MESAEGDTGDTSKEEKTWFIVLVLSVPYVHRNYVELDVELLFPKAFSVKCTYSWCPAGPGTW